LAAKLLGWKIDIKSEEEKRQEVELQMSALVTPSSTPLESVPGLGDGLVEKLSAAGITTVEALADMTPEQLEAIEGIGPKTVEKISLAVNNYFASLEGGEVLAEEDGTQEAVLSDQAVEEQVVDEQAAPSAEESETAGSEEVEAMEAVESLAGQANEDGGETQPGEVSEEPLPATEADAEPGAHDK
jgi:N utilization substance protein A